jgi:hypothetical protein
MDDLTPEQRRRVDQLVRHGFSEERAVEIATEIQLDQPVEHGSGPLEPLPEIQADLDREEES